MVADWVGGILVIVGNYLIGKKNRYGWLVNIAAQVPLIYLNYKLRLWGLVPMNTFLTVVFIKNYWSWSNDSGTQVDGRQREGSHNPAERFPSYTPTMESTTRRSHHNP